MGSASLKRKLRKDAAADDKKRKLARKAQSPNPSRTLLSAETKKKKKKMKEKKEKEKKEKMKKKKKKKKKIPNEPILSDPSSSSSSEEERKRRKRKRERPHKAHSETPSVPVDFPSSPQEEKPRKRKEKKEKKKKKRPRVDHLEILEGVTSFVNPSTLEPLSSEEKKKKKKKKKKEKKNETETETETEKGKKKKKRKLAADSPEEEDRREKKKRIMKKKRNKDRPEVPDESNLSNPPIAELSASADRNHARMLLQRPSSADGNQAQELLESRHPNSGCIAPTSKEMGKRKKKHPKLEKDQPEIPQAQSSSASKPLPFSFDNDYIGNLLEPYSKDQLIDFLCDAALSDPALTARIRTAADCNISHRKVFVRSLPWDVTREDLLELLSPFGPIEDCYVVDDKATGRCKGYGFVLYQSRSGAVEALKQPQKVIKNRVAHCHLASTRPAAQPGGSAGHHAETAGRKIYVSNVPKDVSPGRLKAFFSRFGEVEKGPTGFDLLTGMFKGYTTFVYKTEDGARNALLAPYKMFDGHQLHCQWHTQIAKANAGVPRGTTVAVASPATGPVGAAPQSVHTTITVPQNLSMHCQNPPYAALFGQSPFLAATAGVNPAAARSTPALGGGLTGYGGNSSSAGSQGTSGLQEMQFGQSSSVGPGGSQGGMSAHI